MTRKFLMVDGLDGSGKGVVIDGLKGWADDRDLKIIDLRKWWKENEGFPDIKGYDVVISCEPTFTGIGKKIRENLIRKGSAASPEEIAKAYSDDRKALYENVIVPALEAGKIVLQERGVITSLVYQPLMSSRMSVEDIKKLEGNSYCLKYPPALLIITRVDPKVAMDRLGRREKKDDAMFEELKFQQEISKVYHSEWLKKVFTDLGTTVIYLDTNPPATEEDTMRSAIELFEDLVEA